MRYAYHVKWRELFEWVVGASLLQRAYWGAFPTILVLMFAYQGVLGHIGAGWALVFPVMLVIGRVCSPTLRRDQDEVAAAFSRRSVHGEWANELASRFYARAMMLFALFVGTPFAFFAIAASTGWMAPDFLMFSLIMPVWLLFALNLVHYRVASGRTGRRDG